jgi:mRNA interferase MazF
VYGARYGLSTELPVGVDEGLQHASSVHCDALVSLPKSSLTRFVGTLASGRITEMDRALTTALGIAISTADSSADASPSRWL